jgi:beta-glucosidase
MMQPLLPTPVLPDIDRLPLAVQVAQLMVVRASGHLFDHQRQYPAWEADNAALRYYLGDLGVGGVILLGGSAAEVGVRCQQLQGWAEIPLLLAADIEEGGGQRFAGATELPPPMALAAIAAQDLSQARKLAEQYGALTAQEARAIGLNWLLAPVVDVNNNPANPVINVRAFGDSPAVVSQLTQAFIAGAQQFPVLTTAKHFPGHGDTATDSHLRLPQLDHDLDRLATLEWPPFRQAIAAGVDSIMTAHLRLSALDPVYPATLSPAILTGLLRQEWGFEGLVVTDALIMGAISQDYGPYEAAVLAVEAGADVVLMPEDVEGAIAAICEAVNMGRLSSERIQQSLARIWRAKQKVSGMAPLDNPSKHAWEHQPPPPIQLHQLAQPPARQLIADITTAALECRGQLCACPTTQPGQNLIIVDDLLRQPWLAPDCPALTHPTSLGYQPRLMDARLGELFPGTLSTQPTLLQLFSRGNPFRGTAGLSALALAWFYHLRDSHTLQGLILYGSPYALAALRAELPPEIPYCFTYGQMPGAQAIALTTLCPTDTADRSQSSAFTD